MVAAVFWGVWTGRSLVACHSRRRDRPRVLMIGRNRYGDSFNLLSNQHEGQTLICGAEPAGPAVVLGAPPDHPSPRLVWLDVFARMPVYLKNQTRPECDEFERAIGIGLKWRSGPRKHGTQQKWRNTAGDFSTVFLDRKIGNADCAVCGPCVRHLPPYDGITKS